MPDLQFRKLSPDDSAAMHALERICFSLPWTLEQCAGVLRQTSFAAFGLWQAQKLLAYVSIYHGAGEMEILNLAVQPEMRRRGFGRRVLTMALQVARKMGMEKASLEVRCSNSAAIALYESMGFVPQGRRRNYYPDNGEDAIIYVFLFCKEKS